MITAVLAGSLLQFKDWCRENHANPRDRNIVYVQDSQDLRGLGKPLEVIVYGTFFERRNAEQLHYETLLVQRRNKDFPDPDPPRPWSWTIDTP